MKGITIRKTLRFIVHRVVILFGPFFSHFVNTEIVPTVFLGGEIVKTKHVFYKQNFFVGAIMQR